ncbi:hypothetical protein T492DRAFT_1138694 [Pavlovales sp. CCMP2436]|nr:hypothetical protein T492DRAFT_1138694 [Pavlovales sp. CCMP2436]
MAADLTSPAASSLEGPRDLTSAEGRAHAQASVAEFSRYLKLIGEPYDAFTANRRDRPAQPQNSEEAAAARIGSEPVSMEEVPVLVFDENFKLEVLLMFSLIRQRGRRMCDWPGCLEVSRVSSLRRERAGRVHRGSAGRAWRGRAGWVQPGAGGASGAGSEGQDYTDNILPSFSK